MAIKGDIYKVALPNGDEYNFKDKYVRENYRALNNNDFDTINVTELNSGNIINTGAARFLNTINGSISGNAATASDSAKLNGYASDTSATNNTIARRTANGYIFATYFNQSSGAETPTSSSYMIYANSDGYFRKSTVANMKTAMSLNNVENKSSATIRGEITSANVTTALGYTPVNKAGDTMSGSLHFTASAPLVYDWVHTTESPMIVLKDSANYGIRYKEGDPDTMKFSASGNANTNNADLCINGAGDGTVTIRGNTIIHAGNYTTYTVKKDGTGASGTWSISITGNASTATTATKLGTSTVGGTTTPIYLNAGVPTALSYTIAKSVPSDAKFTDTTYSAGTGLSLSGTTFSVNNSTISPYEAKLQWGGDSKYGAVTPVGMSLSSEHSANRLAFINGACITMEYSADGGSTWTDYGYSAGAKSQFFTLSYGVPIGRASGSSEYTTSSRTRITLTAQNGTTGYVYTNPRKMLINVSVSGGMQVLVETRTGTNYQSDGAWSTFGTYTLAGWSGWNDIPLILSTLGGGTTQKSNNWQLRLTFIITSVNQDAKTTASVNAVRVFGENGWQTTSNLGNTNHMYSYDISQNVAFPANVGAYRFVARGTTYATNTYIDSNPKIYFQNADASQGISLTFSDYDSVQSPASLTLNGNQGGEYFIAPNIKATSNIYVGSTAVSLQGHTHNYAGSDSAGGAANSLKNFQVSTTSSLGTEISTNSHGYVSGLTKAVWNNQQVDGAIYGQFYSASWKHELFADYRTGHMATRGKNNGTWQSWYSVLDTGNIGYAYTSTVEYNPHERKFVTVKSTSSWDAQIYSKSGYVDNVYVTFKPNQTNMAMMIGLNSDPTTDANYSSIDYAIYCQNDGKVSIYENGTSRNVGSPTYAAGDEFRVEYSGGYVVYYHNGTKLREVARGVGAKLYMDSSLHDASSCIYDVEFGPGTKNANWAVSAGSAATATNVAWSGVTSKPTTISGYGITDAKIANGVITLGSNTITPLTSASTLDATKLSGTIPSGCYTDTKNTAGSTDTSSKIFLIGATSQAANPQTYSDDQCYVTSGTLTTANTVATIFGVNQTNGTSGGISLYNSTSQVDNYGIAFRTTANKEKHGYVQSDWATYFTMNDQDNRGWIFRRNKTGGNVASINTNGNMVLNGSLTIGGNTTNTSGARMVYNATLNCIDFTFVA